MNKHNYPGKFIVIEGLDGSGKSAQVELVVRYLQGLGKTVVLTREPTTESEAGRTVRSALRGEVSFAPMELQKLYVQDRAEHLQNKVIPALQRGEWVVSSRYAFSTFAYGYSDGLAVDELVKMNDEFLLPDATILVDVSVDEALGRIESRGEAKELFEKKEKLEKVNEIYKKIPGIFANVSVVDGTKPIPEVFAQIQTILQKLQP